LTTKEINSLLRHLRKTMSCPLKSVIAS
jgi:hypothetical protein